MIPLRDNLPTRRVPVVTLVLIAANAYVFLKVFLLGAYGGQRYLLYYGLIPCSLTGNCVVTGRAFSAEVTLLTSMFVHAGFFHFAGNMLYLWIFGNNVEDSMGRVRFALFYVLCGVAAAYGQILTAKRLNPSDAAIVFLSGKIAYARKMYEDALDALERSRALAQANDEVFLYLGLTNLALGRLADAERDLRLAVYRNARNALAWKALAETYIRLKKWTGAGDAVTRSLAIDPDNAETVLDRALVAMGTGNLSPAAADFEAVAVREDAPGITAYYLGHVYLRLDRRADARSAFERFLKTWEGDPALADEAKAAIDRLSQ